MKETTYPFGSANARTQAPTHRYEDTDGERHTTQPLPRSDRIWTWFKESPGCVISKYLPWGLRQVIHKQLLWGDNRQACHIRSPLFRCTQARTTAAVTETTHIHKSPSHLFTLLHTNTPNVTFTLISRYLSPCWGWILPTDCITGFQQSWTTLEAPSNAAVSPLATNRWILHGTNLSQDSLCKVPKRNASPELSLHHIT